MLVQITNAGIALMQGASSPLVMTGFKLGSDYNYTPSPSQTDIQGTQVYLGVPALPITSSINELLYACQVPSASGPFQFGEIGLYYGSTLFAICVLDSLIDKLPLDPNTNTGGAVVIDFFVPITSSNYQMWANVTQANTVKASTVVGPEGLPASPNANPNLFVVEPAGSGSTFMAFTDRFGIWSFTGFGKVAETTLIGATSTTLTVTATSVAGITFQGLGTIMVQVTGGGAYSAVRYIDGFTPSGSDVVLSLSAALHVVPNAGDSITLYEPATIQTPTGAVGPGSFTTLSATGTTSLGLTHATAIENTPIGATTPSTGKFTALQVTGQTTLGAMSATAINATPIGQAVPAAGSFTDLVVTTSFSGPGIAAMFAAPTPIGSAIPSTGAFTTLTATGQTTLGAVTATSINATPIGQATPAAGSFTTLSANSPATLAGLINTGTSVLNAVTATTVTATGAGQFGTLTVSGSAAFASINSTPIGNTTPSSGTFTTLTATSTTTLAAVNAGAVTATSINSTPIGQSTAAAGRFTTLQATGASVFQAVTAGAMTATAIDNTPIGLTSAAAGQFSTLTVNGTANLNGLTLVGTTSPITLNASVGTSGQVLTSAGPGATPTWSTVATSGSSPSFANLTVTGTSALGTATATSLNSTPIGATTASTGRFTTLQSTSTLSVGGVATFSNGISVNASQGSVNQALLSTGAGSAPVWGNVVLVGSSPSFPALTVTGTATLGTTNTTTLTATAGNVDTLTITGNTRLQINGQTGTAGQVLTSTGNTTAPQWQNVVVTTASITSGTINGTVIGNTTPAAATFNQLSLSGTSAPFLLTGQPGTSGQVLTSQGAGATPIWTTVSGGGSGTVTITGGTINGVTIGGSAPGDATFANLTATGVTSLQTAAATQLQAQQLQITANQPFTVNGSSGTSGQVLTSTGNTTAPTWQAPASSAIAAITSGTISGVVLTTSIIDSTPIGQNSAAAGSFTSVTAANGMKTTQLATPTAATGTGSSTGGTLAAATYYTKIVAVDINGHTTPASSEGSGVTTTGSTSSIAYTWTAVPGATSYQIWYATTAGAEANYFTSTTNSFTLTTTSGATAGTIPALNSTGSLSVAGPATFSSLTVGSINNTPIGNTTPSSGAFTTLSATGAATFADMTASSLNGAVIGNTSSAAGTFTTLVSTSTTTLGAVIATSIDSTPIGASTASTGRFTTITATSGTTLTTVSTTGLTLTSTTSPITLNASVGTSGQVLTSQGAGATPIWSTVAFTGGTLTSALNEAQILTLSSAATVNIGAAAANTLSISGTTTITAFDTLASGAERLLEFQGSLTLTHNATSLILPTGANIVTAAGDVASFVSLGSGNWRCTNYSRASGQALASSGALTNFTDTLNSSTPNATVPVATFTATNAATDVDVVLHPKGLGGIAWDIADNASSGGNKRGQNAVDLQHSRTAAAQVASGNYSVIVGGQNNTSNNTGSVVIGGSTNQATGNTSFIGGGSNNAASNASSAVVGGQNNTASGTSSAVLGGTSNTVSAASSVALGGTGHQVTTGSYQAALWGQTCTVSNSWAAAGGSSCTASGQYSVAFGNSNAASGTGSVSLGGLGTSDGSYSTTMGFQANARGIYGVRAHSSGAFSTSGDNQELRLILRCSTTDATQTTLTSNALAAATTNQLLMQNGSAALVKGTAVSRENSTGDTKSWEFTAHIKRGANAAATSMVAAATVTSVANDSGASAWALAVTADTTNGCLAIAFTGEASKSIKTVATLTSIQLVG